MIKSYRGMLDSSLGDNAQDTISLHTNNGKTGYKIVKMQIFPNQPGAVDTEGTVKVFKVAQPTIDALVDFSDHTLLAAAYYTQNDGPNTTANTIISLFDNETFNQDITVVYDEISGTQQKMNYYIELEQINLTEDQALIAIIKDLRNEQ